MVKWKEKIRTCWHYYCTISKTHCLPMFTFCLVHFAPNSVFKFSMNLLIAVAYLLTSNLRTFSFAIFLQKQLSQSNKPIERWWFLWAQSVNILFTPNYTTLPSFCYLPLYLRNYLSYDIKPTCITFNLLFESVTLCNQHYL